METYRAMAQSKPKNTTYNRKVNVFYDIIVLFLKIVNGVTTR